MRPRPLVCVLLLACEPQVPEPLQPCLTTDWSRAELVVGDGQREGQALIDVQNTCQSSVAAWIAAEPADRFVVAGPDRVQLGPGVTRGLHLSYVMRPAERTEVIEGRITLAEERPGTPTLEVPLRLRAEGLDPDEGDGSRPVGTLEARGQVGCPTAVTGSVRYDGEVAGRIVLDALDDDALRWTTRPSGSVEPGLTVPIAATVWPDRRGWTQYLGTVRTEPDDGWRRSVVLNVHGVRPAVRLEDHPVTRRIRPEVGPDPATLQVTTRPDGRLWDWWHWDDDAGVVRVDIDGIGEGATGLRIAYRPLGDCP